MKLVVDGLIFQKDPYGGIARIFREVLPLLCSLDQGLSIKLLIDGPIRGELPSHPQIEIQRMPAVRHTLRPRGVARKLIYPFRRVASRAWNVTRQLWIGRGKGAIWHSTFYTVPEIWDGPQVVTIHDMIPERFLSYYNDPLDEIGRRQKRRCQERAAATICDSETTKRELQQIYNLSSDGLYVIHIAYNPVFQVLPASDTGFDDIPNRPFLLYVGSRSYYKNFLGLLDIYSAWENKSRVQLLAVGPPWSDEEIHTIKEKGLQERVHLLTNVNDQSLCRLYNRAEAFVFPSLAEGFGIPLLEAMACGCPVVASSIPSTLEVAGDCPFYFELSEPATWLSAFDQALTQGHGDPRVQAGLQRVKLFTWENTARKMLDVYREVSSKKTMHLDQ